MAEALSVVKAPDQIGAFRHPGQPSQRGVFWSSWNSKWESWLSIGCQPFFLGYFDSVEESAYAQNTVLFCHLQGLTSQCTSPVNEVHALPWKAPLKPLLSIKVTLSGLLLATGQLFPKTLLVSFGLTSSNLLQGRKILQVKNGTTIINNVPDRPSDVGPPKGGGNHLFLESKCSLSPYLICKKRLARLHLQMMKLLVSDAEEPKENQRGPSLPSMQPSVQFPLKVPAAPVHCSESRLQDGAKDAAEQQWAAHGMAQHLPCVRGIFPKGKLFK